MILCSIYHSLQWITCCLAPNVVWIANIQLRHNIRSSLFLCLPHRTFNDIQLACIYRTATVVIYKCLIIEHVIIRLFLSESLVIVDQSSVCWQQRINSTVCLITISGCCHHLNTDRLRHAAQLCLTSMAVTLFKGHFVVESKINCIRLDF